MRKRILQGLSKEDYIHDDERSMRNDYLDKILVGLDTINDLSVALMRKVTLGCYIEVTNKTAPDLFNIISNVCDILCFHPIPKVYICHEPSQANMCAGTGEMVMILSDFILEHFDTDMLYFTIGNTISMFKSGHVKIVTAYSILPETIVTAPIELLMKKYLRAADMTSDRGGLLACQNIAAALKCILWEAGISLNEIRFLDEDETISLAKAYLQGIAYFSMESLSILATNLSEKNMDLKPHPYRITELLNWYESGYSEIIQKKGVRIDE